MHYHFISAQPLMMDLGLVFGSQGGDPQATLNIQKDIARKIVEKYAISTSGALVGAILYGSDANIAWKIGQAADILSVNENIDEIKATKVGKNVRKALQVARDELFSLANGARRNIPKTLILFASETEGKDSTIDGVAKQLKDNGVNVIVLALGSNVKKQDLSGIASDPSKLITLKDPTKELSDVIPRIDSKSLPGINFKRSCKCNLFLSSLSRLLLSTLQSTLSTLCVASR